MNRAQSLLTPAILALVLVAIAGLLPHWLRPDAAETAARLQAMGELLVQAPLVVADWQGRPDSEDGERAVPGAPGGAQFHYTVRRQGTEITVSACLVLGDGRAVADHRPAACFPGSGLRVEGVPGDASLESEGFTASFQTAAFTKEDATASRRLRLFWAWSVDGTWEAPRWPEGRLAGAPAVKIYLSADEPSQQLPENSRCLELAAALLPELSRHLFPPPAQSEAK